MPGNFGIIDGYLVFGRLDAILNFLVSGFSADIVGMTTSEHNEQDNPERPHIHGGLYGLCPKDGFGRRVCRCWSPEDRVRFQFLFACYGRFAIVPYKYGGSKICHLDYRISSSRCSQQDILRFEISMHQANPVQIQKGRCNFPNNSRGIHLRIGPHLDQVVKELAALNEIQNQNIGITVLEMFVQGNDVGVASLFLNIKHGLHFLLEVLGVSVLFRNVFQRHLLAGVFGNSSVDFGVCTLTNHLFLVPVVFRLNRRLGLVFVQQTQSPVLAHEGCVLVLGQD
mmetsp:Transcript_3229/g.8943  ORF Transcript_3229/g.8943 Transcript_3229/m.8943 type:complete len:282 (-) Transcript_3229:624-1469(-)